MLPVSMVMPRNHLSLKFLRLDSPVVPRPTGIVTLKNRALSPLAELFIDRVRTLAKPLAKLR
jgi:DNA-binding transcriptional LysR family regulator